MNAKLKKSEVSIYRKSGNFVVGLVFWSLVIGIFSIVFLSSPTYKFSQESVAYDVDLVEEAILSPTQVELAASNNVEPFQNNQQIKSESNASAESVLPPDSLTQVAKVDESSNVAETVTEGLQTINSGVAAAQSKSTDQSSDIVPAGWYVQVGAFESAVNAGVFQLKFTTINFPTEVERGDDRLSRVLVGPYNSEKDAIQTRRILSKEHKIKGGIIRDFTSS